MYMFINNMLPICFKTNQMQPGGLFITMFFGTAVSSFSTELLFVYRAGKTFPSRVLYYRIVYIVASQETDHYKQPV